jgi:hypothetical protein
MLAAVLDLGLLIIVVLCFTQLLCGKSSTNGGSPVPTKPQQE